MSDLGIGDGAWPILLTAFDENNNLDLPAVGALLDFYRELGIPGVLALGQASEMLLLSIDERMRVAEFVAKHPRGDLGRRDRRQLRRDSRRASAQPAAYLRHGDRRCRRSTIAAAIGGGPRRAIACADAAGQSRCEAGHL